MRKNMIIITGLSLLMAFAPMIGPVATPMSQAFGVIEVMAAETTGKLQSDKWTLVDNVWKVKDGKGGYMKSCWFQDLDSSWYILDENGAIYSGLVFDKTSNAHYYLNINHDGSFGQMQTKDGTYSVNGQSIYLTFEQSHQGNFGAIKSGLEALRTAGLKETTIGQTSTENTAPVVDAKAVEDAINNAQQPTGTTNNNTSAQAQESTASSSTNNNNTTTSSSESQAQSDYDFMSQFVFDGSEGNGGACDNISQEDLDNFNEAVENSYGY